MTVRVLGELIDPERASIPPPGIDVQQHDIRFLLEASCNCFVAVAGLPLTT
ncbi:MAG: hypothetical protein M9908_12350 [Phyllobacteriaceae bacterium]|nr:hypothetical protein [Phyllobacteriaceae bacterium]